MTSTPHALVGSVRRFDFQSDVWQRDYQITAHLGADLYEAELLPMRPEVLDAMLDLAAIEDEGGYYGMFGHDKLAGVQAEWGREVAETGRTFKIRLVSRAQYEAAF